MDGKELELDTDNNSENYEMEAICDSVIYIRKSEDYLPGYYCLIL